jgi:hypothetical protein
MLRLEAPVTFHARVVLPPPAGKLAGVAVKLTITGAPGGGVGLTVTLAVAVTLPLALLAIRVKVVLAVTLTAFELPVTAPTPGLMLRLEAFTAFQARVTLPGALKEAGEAVKLVMVGGEGELHATTANSGASTATLSKNNRRTFM